MPSCSQSSRAPEGALDDCSNGGALRQSRRNACARTGVVEVDEKLIGRKKGVPVRRGASHKHAVLTLVQRGGQARTVHVENIKTRTVVPIERDWA
jgi:hypothetical protein